MSPPVQILCSTCKYFRATPNLSPLNPTWGECLRYPGQNIDTKPFDPTLRVVRGVH